MEDKQQKYQGFSYEELENKLKIINSETAEIKERSYRISRRLNGTRKIFEAYLGHINANLHMGGTMSDNYVYLGKIADCMVDNKVLPNEEAAELVKRIGGVLENIEMLKPGFKSRFQKENLTGRLDVVQ